MKKILFPFLILTLLVTSCSEKMSVTADWDKTIDFTQFKTYSYYGWAKSSDQYIGQLDKKRLEEAFANEFKLRGITYVESGGDLVVSLFIVVNQETATTAYTNHYGYGGYGYGGYYSPWGWGGGYATTSYHTYDYYVGTLVCDVFDDAKKELIWQGVGAGAIEDNPSKRGKTIPYTVRNIMSYYPVKPIKK